MRLKTIIIVSILIIFVSIFATGCSSNHGFCHNKEGLHKKYADKAFEKLTKKLNLSQEQAGILNRIKGRMLHGTDETDNKHKAFVMAGMGLLLRLNNRFGTRTKEGQ